MGERVNFQSSSILNWFITQTRLQSWTKLLRKLYTWSIFLNIVAVPVLPSSPSPESNVVVYSKESLIPGRLWEATLNWGKGFSFRKGVVLEIVLLRRKVDMMGKTFSRSFVRDCGSGNRQPRLVTYLNYSAANPGGFAAILQL